MFKTFSRSSLFLGCLIFVLLFSDAVTAQKRRRPAPKKPIVESISEEDKAAALENLQGAKVLQLLAKLQLGLAEAYVENRNLGEIKANAAMNELIIEKLRHPSSIYTIYANARGNAIWIEYLLDQNGQGKDAESDKQIAFFHESLRSNIEKGLTVNPDAAHIIAARGTLRELDCRLQSKTAVADCYDLPLADFTRAIALKPDEIDFFSLRADFYKRNEKTALAAKDEQSTISLGNALELKLELDKKATARRPFHTERANADMLYFMKILSLLMDADIKTQLSDNAFTLKSFRETLMEYYTLADEGFVKSNSLKPAAENLERRGTLRFHIGLFADSLGFESPSQFARKNFEEAVAFYTDALKLDPKFADAYENRARSYRKLDRKEPAEADEKQLESLKGK